MDINLQNNPLPQSWEMIFWKFSLGTVKLIFWNGWDICYALWNISQTTGATMLKIGTYTDPGIPWPEKLDFSGSLLYSSHFWYFHPKLPRPHDKLNNSGPNKHNNNFFMSNSHKSNALACLKSTIIYLEYTSQGRNSREGDTQKVENPCQRVTSVPPF